MVTKAKADIATLENALEQYRLDNLTYPASGDGLNALVTAPPALAQPERYRRGGYIKKLPADPWGRPYNYQAPGASGAAFTVQAVPFINTHHQRPTSLEHEARYVRVLIGNLGLGVQHKQNHIEIGRAHV